LHAGTTEGKAVSTSDLAAVPSVAIALLLAGFVGRANTPQAIG
jgi:hypothetical protein